MFHSGLIGHDWEGDKDSVKCKYVGILVIYNINANDHLNPQCVTFAEMGSPLMTFFFIVFSLLGCRTSFST